MNRADAPSDRKPPETVPARGDKRRYVLRLYDEPLLEFVLSQEDPPGRGNGCAVSDVNVLSEKTHLFPYGLTASCEGIESWLRDRIIPENRYYADEILASLGLRRSDTMGILDASKGVSLNDSYRVSRSDDAGSFAECNAYENPFDIKFFLDKSDFLYLFFRTAVEEEFPYSREPLFDAAGWRTPRYRITKGSLVTSSCRAEVSARSRRAPSSLCP